MSVRWAMMIQSMEDVEKAATAGFDCVQCPASFAVGHREEDAAPQERFMKRTGLPCEISAVPLPSDVRVTEKGFNLYAWLEHVKRSLDHLSRLGCRTLVWNDGRARLLPLEGDQTAAREQALQFLYVLCGAAEERGMTVLVEPLGFRRTNFLNTLDEVRAIQPLVGKENFGAAVSLRELEPIELSLEALASYGGLIQHVHMENPLSSERTRVSPRVDDGYEYRPFLSGLRRGAYSRTICLPQDAERSDLSYCKRLWSE